MTRKDNGIRKDNGALALFMIFLVIALAGVYFYRKHQASHHFYDYYTEISLMNLARNRIESTPVDFTGSEHENRMSEDQVLSWVKDTVPEIIAFNSHTLKKHLSDISVYFTPDGYKSFTRALYKSRTPDMIIANDMQVKTSLSGEPEIIFESVKRNRQKDYAWGVRVPVKMVYYTQDKTRIDPLILEILVIQPRLNRRAVHALYLEQWIAL